MNCGRVSNQLSAYLDRELTGVEMLQIRSHLTECDRCRSEHEALCRLKMMLGRLQSLEPPRGFVGDTVRRFDLSPLRPSSMARWGRESSRFFAIVRLLQALEVKRAPLSSVGGMIGPPLVVQRLLSLIPWRPLTMGLTTAALAAALIFTSVILHRHADTLVASTPPEVMLGQDRDSLNPQQLFYWAPDQFPPHNIVRDRLPDGQTSLPWVPVSLQAETSWTFR
jgi:putative zinc finger protein